MGSQSIRDGAGHGDGSAQSPAIPEGLFSPFGADFVPPPRPEKPDALPSARLPSAALAKMVEGEIIPRLMLAHRQASVPANNVEQRHRPLSPDTAEAFAGMVLTKESESLLAYVGALLQGGVSLEAIYVELLAPAARRLGDYWNDDTISFADVTIGLGRLQQVVRGLGQQAPMSMHDNRLGRAALFVPAPSEQHTFGLVIVEDFFRRAGWRTWIEPSATQREIRDMLKGQWFDIIGLSASRPEQLDLLALTIMYARRASRNPDITVMVGGRLFVEQPELVAAVGADATASDAGEALLVADQAVRQLGRVS